MNKQKKRLGKTGSKSYRGLTIHFMPYSEISLENSIERVKKIIKIVRENKIIILQGVLKPEEEVKLIEHSMILASNLDGFSGIELATLSGKEDNSNLFQKIKMNIARILIGDHDKITIIGPANIIKEIKKDPNKMELFLERK